jgi:hypothetical protein
VGAELKSLCLLVLGTVWVVMGWPIPHKPHIFYLILLSDSLPCILPSSCILSPGPPSSQCQVQAMRKMPPWSQNHPGYGSLCEALTGHELVIRTQHLAGL